MRKHWFQLSGSWSLIMHDASSSAEAVNHVLAHQVVDDILDVTQTTEMLGKTAAKDLAVNKTTYPKLLGIEKSKQIADELIQEAIQQLDDFECSRAAPLIALAKFIGYRQN